MGSQFAALGMHFTDLPVMTLPIPCCESRKKSRHPFFLQPRQGRALGWHGRDVPAGREHSGGSQQLLEQAMSHPLHLARANITTTLLGSREDSCFIPNYLLKRCSVQKKKNNLGFAEMKFAFIACYGFCS